MPQNDPGMPPCPSRRGVLTWGFGAVAAMSLAACGIRLEDDAPRVPLIPTRKPVPGESFLLALWRHSDDLAERATSLGGPATGVPARLAALHRRQVTVLESELLRLGVPRKVLDAAAAGPSATGTATGRRRVRLAPARRRVARPRLGRLPRAPLPPHLGERPQGPGRRRGERPRTDGHRVAGDRPVERDPPRRAASSPSALRRRPCWARPRPGPSRAGRPRPWRRPTSTARAPPSMPSRSSPPSHRRAPSTPWRWPRSLPWSRGHRTRSPWRAHRPAHPPSGTPCPSP